MNDEKLITDLFEAARAEAPVRSLQSVEEALTTTAANTSLSLVIKWLKQNKMNMLITSSGILITATILFFPKQEVVEENVIEYVVPTVESVQEEKLPQQEVEAAVTPEEKESQLTTSITQDTEMIEEPPIGATTGARTSTDSGNVKVVVSTSPPEEEPSHTVMDTRKVASKEVAAEYLIVLESNKGRDAVDKFSAYLEKNLSQLDHEFTSSANKKEIRKFTLKLDNRHRANFRMQVSGFDKLELHWSVDQEGEIADMWYRLDAKEKKSLNFSKSEKFSVRVKHTHEEF